jgi:hypothetical protein
LVKGNFPNFQKKYVSTIKFVIGAMVKSFLQPIKNPTVWIYGSRPTRKEKVNILKLKINLSFVSLKIGQKLAKNFQQI